MLHSHLCSCVLRAGRQGVQHVRGARRDAEELQDARAADVRLAAAAAGRARQRRHHAQEEAGVSAGVTVQ